MLDRTEKQIANFIFAFFSDNLCYISNWGFYLFDQEFDKEVELRNKISAVWICSLLDTIDGKERIYDDLRARASQFENKYLIQYCDHIESLSEAVKDVLNLYSKEEQLFVFDFRDQLVHSWRWKVHQPDFWVTYFADDKIKKEKQEFDDYHASIRSFYEAGIDNSMKQIVERFKNSPTRYWAAIRELQKPGIMDKIHKEKFMGIDSAAKN